MFTSASPTPPNALGFASRPVPLPPTLPVRDAGALEFRQLRHLTKNAIQRLLCEVARATELQSDWQQRRLLADLERRLLLSAAVSDALFGFTAHPAGTLQRLKTLADATVELMAGSDQSIAVTVTLDGIPQTSHVPVLLQVAHEMVGNAVKHGMRERMVGRIEVHLTTDEDGARLTVRDDGWGPGDTTQDGCGLGMMRELGKPIGATVSLTRKQDWTIAALDIPRRRHPSRLNLMSVWPMLPLLPAAAILSSWYCGLL